MRGRLLAAAAAALAMACGGDVRPAENLLLITLDTLRADRLGAYGYPRSTSPRLDAFAARATVFTDVTCSMPTTLPSHLSIFTGLSPDQHGVWQNGVPPGRDLVSLFDLLRERGLETAAVVGSGVLAAEFLAGLGFDEVLDRNLEEHGHQLPGAEVSRRAAAWLRARGGRPFALWVHYYDTHEPYTPAAEVAELFTRDYRGELGEAISGAWLNRLNRRGAEPLPAEDLAYVRGLYDAEVRELDTAVGTLLDVLAEQRLEGSTLVAVVGDHGQALGEQGRYGHGEWLLEPIIKVPFLLRLPGQEQGRVVASAAETLDLLPTVAELFRLPVPAGLGGRSLVPALAGGPIPPSGPRITLRRTYSSAPERLGIAISRGREKWTYLRERRGELVHLGRVDGKGGLDGENFQSEEPEAAAALAAMARGKLAPPTDRPELSTETRAMLEALGYVD